jgi:hypothetical protein
MAIAVAEMRRNYDQGNMLERSRYRERLKALLQTTPRGQLQQTRAYAEREPGQPQPDQQYRDLGKQAQTELEDAADEAFGPQPGHESA